MSVWTSINLRAATGGVWLRRPDAPEDEPLAQNVSTDTRTTRANDAFVALRGDRFDAHEFLAKAADSGASLLIVDQPERVAPALLRSGAGPAILRVADTRRALGQIAAAHRRTLEGVRIIAVVGSNGKTTTTKLIHAALASKLRGSCSPRSFNNDVGVPLTILAAKRSDQYLVCEVGSNHPGETAALARIVQPDIVVITSIGRDHMEFFGTPESIAREHASILPHLTPGGTAVVPAGAPLLADYLKPVPHVLTFGRTRDADLWLSSIAHEPLASGHTGLRFTINDRWSVELPMLGEHNALNALAAASVARRMGIDDASISRGLSAAAPADMRLNQRSMFGAQFIVDCYNSNPDSLEAALLTTAQIARDASRRVLVLGDMLEMGEHAHAVHLEALGRIAEVCPARAVVLVGGAMAKAFESHGASAALRDAIVLPSLDDADAIERALNPIRPGDTVLLKGSRGVRLERLLSALESRSTRAPGPVITNASHALNPAPSR